MEEDVSVVHCVVGLGNDSLGPVNQRGGAAGPVFILKTAKLHLNVSVLLFLSDLQVSQEAPAQITALFYHAIRLKFCNPEHSFGAFLLN
jgi:hypothetical protein